MLKARPIICLVHDVDDALSSGPLPVLGIVQSLCASLQDNPCGNILEGLDKPEPDEDIERKALSEFEWTQISRFERYATKMKVMRYTATDVLQVLRNGRYPNEVVKRYGYEVKLWSARE